MKHHTPRNPAGIALLSLAVAIIFTLASVVPAAAQDFGEPEPGRLVHDRAGLLTDAELEHLQSLAEEVEAAGAPIAVFLRANESDGDSTIQDGRDLMEQWNIQSSAGARDGVVLFLNLDPDDLRRGELALIAGEAHVDGGNLPQHELDRITSRMLDFLRDDETAAGVAAGLEMLATSLREGPPPPPPPTRFESFSDSMASGILSPLTGIALISIAVIGFIWRKVWSNKPASDVPATPTTSPPDALLPAAAGALVTGSVSDAQVDATILDLVSRGALAFEPEDDKKIRMQLLDRGVIENPLEDEVWNALEGQTDSNGRISSDGLAKARHEFAPARARLRELMVDSGWFDPDARSRRVPLYISGVIVLLLAALSLTFTVVSEQPWGLVGTVAMTLAGFGSIIAGASYPGTTRQGEDRAQPWRGYLQGIKDVQKDPDYQIDLDEAMPYLVALSASNLVDDRLKRASENGYVPLWLAGSRAGSEWIGVGFYPYWITLIAATSPSTGASTATGDSVGSGASGGRF